MSFFKQLGAYSSNVIELASEKCSGFSIRGIKEDDEKKEDSVQQHINPKDTRIGEKLWDTKNLDVCKYRNGDEIPQVQDTHFFWLLRFTCRGMYSTLKSCRTWRKTVVFMQSSSSVTPLQQFCEQQISCHLLCCTEKRKQR
jgi:hypothetical protein